MNCRTVLMRLLPAICVICILPGCGGSPSDLPELGTVYGVVTLDETPLANARLSFEPDNGRPSSGVTDEKGYYELQYTADYDGAKVTQHVVRISRGSGMDEMMLRGGPGRAPNQTTPTEPPLPARYGSKSTLTADVKAGSNEFNFQLESDRR